MLAKNVTMSMCEQHPEVVQKVDNLQFPGAGLKSTKAYLEAFSATTGIPVVELLEVYEGHDGGTWALSVLAKNVTIEECPRGELTTLDTLALRTPTDIGHNHE